MKFFSSVSLSFFIIIATSFSMIGCHEDVESMKKQAIAQCSEKHQINTEAVQDILNHKQVSEDYEVKCWLSCVMKKIGMIKEGKIDWEYCKGMAKHDLLDEKDKAKIDKIAEICQAEVPQDEEDECQLAYSAAVCKINHWKELGLPQVNQR